MGVRCLLNMASIRDLLAIVTSFSLLSLYLTYHLGFLDSNGHSSRDLFAPLAPRSAQLKQLLAELERSQLHVSRLVAFLRGGGRDRSILVAALHTRGFEISLEDIPTDEENWTLLFCFDMDDATCITYQETTSVKSYQKVNQIAGLSRVFGNRSDLCQLASRLAGLPALHDSPLTPTCFTLPEQYEAYLNTADSMGFNHSWMIKPSKGNIEHLSTMEFFSKVRRKKFPDRDESVVQQFVPNQLRVLGAPISVQLFVLVTSIAPLRVYVYNEGVVSFRHGEGNNFKKFSKKWWLLSQLWHHLGTTIGPQAVESALHNTDTLITHLLMGAESFLLVSWSNITSCHTCFQLLTVDLMYNTSLNPVVMAVSDQPVLTVGTDRLTTAVLHDVIKIITADTVIHQDVVEYLMTSHNKGVAGIECLHSDELCLSDADLLWLLTSRRETVDGGDGGTQFRRLYPTKSGAQYTTYLSQLQSILPSNHLSASRHSTYKMHDFLTQLEVLYATEDQVFLQDKSNKSQSFHWHGHQTAQLPYLNSSVNQDASSRENCSKDNALFMYIQSIHITPSIRLSPSFTPLWSEYTAEVEYELTMVRIKAVTMHCYSSVRFEHHHVPTISLNTTLGLGVNRLVLLVQRRTTDDVLNTYVLKITRLQPVYKPSTNPRQLIQACNFHQDCAYQVLPNTSCGLQKAVESSKAGWNQFLDHIQSLPPCSTGDASGRWVVPCASCSEASSCNWSTARWQPFSCSHHLLTRERLALCLQGKKLLFLGDSTNRGMMHYILERLNGSLAGCEKTHHMRVYHHGHTTLSFAYYPQFWLQPHDRPVFDQTLYQLLLKSQPLQNTSDTVVVVGGVHWLATHHLHMLLRVMRREGLQGARLFVKTLGSGFHIAAEGVHYLDPSQQAKLVHHSMGLAALARHHGMEVIDTFNMTSARYRQFLQGRCACHFHKLVPTVKGYHVEGPINAVYTEILLSRICPLQNYKFH